MAPNAQALTALRDIHQPLAIGWWPLAKGWYILAVFLIVLTAMAITLIRRYQRNRRGKREALRLLAIYQQQYQREKNTAQTAARVSELLKRVALIYFPRTEVASLQGDAWLVFLNETAKSLDFNRVREALLECPFQPSSDKPLDALFDLARRWITQRRKPCLS